MNKNRIAGAARYVAGKAERAVGETVDNERLEGRGVVDQVAGAVQNGYGRVKDGVADVIDDAPETLGRAANKMRKLKQGGMPISGCDRQMPAMQTSHGRAS